MSEMVESEGLENDGAEQGGEREQQQAGGAIEARASVGFEVLH